MAKKSSTRKAKDTPKTAQASWCSLFIKHSTRGPDIDEVTEELSEDSQFASASNDEVNPWLTGKAIKSSGPTVVCVSIARQKWLSLVSGAIDAKFASRTGRRKKLKTIYVGYDNEKSSSFFRYYENGKMQVDFEVRGAPDSCIEKYRLKTTKSVKSYVEKASNIGMAIKALLNKFDAISPEIRIEHDGLNQKLVRVDGSKLATKQIREISVLKYYALVDGENAASDLLALALHEGKPAKIKKAIKAGANLQHIPSSPFGPIRHAVIGVDGDWEECTRLLAKAGAPIDGLAGEEPPIVGVCQSYGTLNVRGTDDASVIERIKLLLSLGANINARVYTSAPPGWTALHKATDSCRLKVVKFLVSKRADSSVQDSKGQRAIDIASELSKIYHGEMGEASKAIVKLLKSKKTSKLRNTGGGINGAFAQNSGNLEIDYSGGEFGGGEYGVEDLGLWYEQGIEAEEYGGVGDYGADPNATEDDSVADSEKEENAEEEAQGGKGVDPLYAMGGNSIQPLAVGGFASQHAGVALFAYADGSVRVVGESMDLSLLQKLADRKDGAIVDEY